MSNNLLTVSLAPHERGEFSVKSIMFTVIIALVPALLVSVYLFGFNALRVIVIAILSSIFFEYVIQKFLLKSQLTITDGSAILTGLLLAFNLPSNLPTWIIVIGSLVAIGIGKMSFGGLGNNPFNPALVGRVFLLISFPVQMTSWPIPGEAFLTLDAVTAATPLGVLKEGLLSFQSVPMLMKNEPSYWHMFLGKTGGCLGETSDLALLIGAIILLRRRIISWHIPFSMIGTIVLFAGGLHLLDPQKFADPLFHVLSGGVTLGAFFMATDYVTSPMTQQGMIIYGCLIGLLTIIIRTFGAYPEGVSFAILIMNGFVPLINRYCKPKRFGE